VVRTTLDDSPFGQVLKEDGQRNGVKFIGSDGWIWVNRDEITASKPELLSEPLPDNAIHLEVSRNHMGNFMECVTSRKDPVSKVEDGHRSAVIGHLIIIALRSGKNATGIRRRKFSPAKARKKPTPTSPAKCASPTITVSRVETPLTPRIDCR